MSRYRPRRNKTLCYVHAVNSRLFAFAALVLLSASATSPFQLYVPDYNTAPEPGVTTHTTNPSHTMRYTIVVHGGSPGAARKRAASAGLSLLSHDIERLLKQMGRSNDQTARLIALYAQSRPPQLTPVANAKPASNRSQRDYRFVSQPMPTGRGFSQDFCAQTASNRRVFVIVRPDASASDASLGDTPGTLQARLESALEASGLAVFDLGLAEGDSELASVANRVSSRGATAKDTSVLGAAGLANILCAVDYSVVGDSLSDPDAGTSYRATVRVSSIRAVLAENASVLFNGGSTPLEGTASGLTMDEARTKATRLAADRIEQLVPDALGEAIRQKIPETTRVYVMPDVPADQSRDVIEFAAAHGLKAEPAASSRGGVAIRVTSVEKKLPIVAVLQGYHTKSRIIALPDGQT